MTRRIYELYLRDILDSLDIIAEYVRGKTEAEFLANGQLQDAVVRRMEIIGEAGRNLAGLLGINILIFPGRS